MEAIPPVVDFLNELHVETPALVANKGSNRRLAWCGTSIENVGRHDLARVISRQRHVELILDVAYKATTCSAKADDLAVVPVKANPLGGDALNYK